MNILLICTQIYLTYIIICSFIYSSIHLDSERGLALDAVALMGGNEYLVQQMIDKLTDTPFR